MKGFSSVSFSDHVLEGCWSRIGRVTFVKKYEWSFTEGLKLFLDMNYPNNLLLVRGIKVEC